MPFLQLAMELKMASHIGSLRIHGEQTGVLMVTLRWSWERTCVVSALVCWTFCSFPKYIKKYHRRWKTSSIVLTLATYDSPNLCIICAVLFWNITNAIDLASQVWQHVHLTLLLVLKGCRRTSKVCGINSSCFILWCSHFASSIQAKWGVLYLLLFKLFSGFNVQNKDYRYLKVIVNQDIYVYKCTAPFTDLPEHDGFRYWLCIMHMIYTIE